MCIDGPTCNAPVKSVSMSLPSSGDWTKSGLSINGTSPTPYPFGLSLTRSTDM